jgi:pimeloyl-ACP methyl ester carboxylesterase
MTTETEPWTHREEIVNGILLHWVEQGQGPLVLLLHGFPESGTRGVTRFNG